MTMEKYDLFINKFGEVWKILKKESVRGSVIVSCAIIEDQLENLLKARLISCEVDKWDNLFNGPNSPLGNMSAKIDIAFSTACISDKTRQSLHILRKLRNEFAHLSINIDFETQSVKDRTESLLKLNREFVEITWGSVRTEIFSELGITNPPECTDLFSDMFKHVGYRNTFEIWASALAGALAESSNVINRIESKNSNS